MSKSTNMIEVDFHDGSLMLPKTCKDEKSGLPLYPQAHQLLNEHEEYNTKPIHRTVDFDHYTLQDVAYALHRYLRNVYGRINVTTPDGGTVTELSIQLPDGTLEHVAVGQFKLPDAPVAFYLGRNSSTFRASLQFHGARSYSHLFDETVRAMRELLREESLYQGINCEVVKVNVSGGFFSPDGEYFELKPLSGIRSISDKLVFDRLTTGLIEHNVFAPLMYWDTLAECTGQTPRGAILDGLPGTGKTEVINEAARIAVERGWTVMHITDKDLLNEGMKLAKQYSPCLLVMEDLDQIMQNQEGESRDGRTKYVNEIINALSGSTSKDSRVFFIATTNHSDLLPAVLTRKERFDSVIRLLCPDAPTTERILRAWSNGNIPSSVDISEAAGMLAGLKPSTIVQALDRARKAWVWRTCGKSNDMTFTSEDLISAAAEILNEEHVEVPATEQRVRVADLDVVFANDLPQTPNGMGAIANVS